MTVPEICALNIPIEDNAVLYLWATAPKLLEALQVMEAWGFKYKTQAIWDKCHIGMGYWFRGQHEILMVGTKGKFSPPTQEHRISSIFKTPRTKHSKKPDEFRDMIKLWFPNKSRLELFSRDKFDGWDSWGNEIDSDINIVT